MRHKWTFNLALAYQLSDFFRFKFQAGTIFQQKIITSFGKFPFFNASINVGQNQRTPKIRNLYAEEISILYVCGMKNGLDSRKKEKNMQNKDVFFSSQNSLQGKLKVCHNGITQNGKERGRFFMSRQLGSWERGRVKISCCKVAIKLPLDPPLTGSCHCQHISVGKYDINL